jgi:hypothetical protein
MSDARLRPLVRAGARQRPRHSVRLIAPKCPLCGPSRCPHDSAQITEVTAADCRGRLCPPPQHTHTTQASLLAARTQCEDCRATATPRRHAWPERGRPKRPRSRQRAGRGAGAQERRGAGGGGRARAGLAPGGCAVLILPHLVAERGVGFALLLGHALVHVREKVAKHSPRGGLRAGSR